jgi:hypothetical protein
VSARASALGGACFASAVLVTAALVAADLVVASDGAIAQEVPMPAAPDAPAFADDVKFLQEHADAIVLQAEGCGPVVVSAKLSARVMTSAFSADAPGFGLVNRAQILPPATNAAADTAPRAFANYGGEDRLWITPEGGPWALFFASGSEQVGAHWAVPPELDGGAHPVVQQDGQSVAFAWTAHLRNVAGTEFSLRVARTLAVLSRVDVSDLLAQAAPGSVLGDGVRVVAFRSGNRLTWLDKPPTGAGEVGLWVLGQFVPHDDTRVLLPFRGPVATRDVDPLAALKRDYFGTVPDERLQLVRAARDTSGAPAPSASASAGAASADAPAADAVTGVARFTADSRLRSKIGLSRAGATGWFGAWDPGRGVLTLVHCTLPAPGATVPDCDWKPGNAHPGAGDVVTSYNDGGEPRFFELESLSAALPRKPGGAVQHEQTTIHLGGDRAALAPIARAILHVEL